MAFCNLFVNFNFRLPHIHSCGCSMPFFGNWNFPTMPNFFGFNGGFGCCNNSFGSLFSFMPNFGFNNFNNNIFSFYNQPTTSFVGSWNQVQTSLPQWQSPSAQSLWNQVPTNTVTNTATWNSTATWSNTTSKVSNSSSTSSNGKTSFTTYSKSVSGSVDNSYANLSKTQAERKAQNDNRLERLDGGKGWSLASTFETDIPFAKRGTAKILDKVASLVGENLVITSALGTAGTSSQRTPHKIGGYASHHNAENPKLDIDITSRSHGEKLAQKLRETGYFNHISIESDHLDVQIDPRKFESLSAMA